MPLIIVCAGGVPSHSTVNRRVGDSDEVLHPRRPPRRGAQVRRAQDLRW